MSEKPEALRLATQLEDTESARLHLLPYAAAELRRLHAVNQELLEALKEFVSHYGNSDVHRWMEIRNQARAAIARAEGQA